MPRPNTGSRVGAWPTIGVVTATLCGVAPATSVRAAPAPAPGGVEFVWDAPAQGCPQEPEVVAELERLLEGPVDAPQRGRLAAIARIRREADGRWDLRLWTVTPDDTRQRSMQGDDCHVLADAAALLAAMAIDPDVLARTTTSEAAADTADRAQDFVDDPTDAPAAPAPAPDPETPEPEAPEPETPRPNGPMVEPTPEPEPGQPSRPWIIGVRTQVGVSFGDLPAVGPIARLGLAWQRERLRLEVDGHYAFVRRARFSGSPELGADLRLAAGAIRGCGVIEPARAPLEIPVCGGLEAGAMLGRGVGFITVSDGTVPWLALDLAPSLVWTARPWLALSLTVEPWVALVRGRMQVDDGTLLWRPFPVGIRVFGGVEARF